MKTRVRKKDFNYFSMKKYDGMMGRCYRESDRSFKNYGAKGIRVCIAWIKNIESFRGWLKQELERLSMTIDQFCEQSQKLQLDRIDPKGHYTTHNCRLVSAQANTRNRFVTKGKKIISAEGDIYEF